jgi:hypothetical protein
MRGGMPPDVRGCQPLNTRTLTPFLETAQSSLLAAAFGPRPQKIRHWAPLTPTRWEIAQSQKRESELDAARLRTLTPFLETAQSLLLAAAFGPRAQQISHWAPLTRRVGKLPSRKKGSQSWRQHDSGKVVAEIVRKLGIGLISKRTWASGSADCGHFRRSMTIATCKPGSGSTP